MGGAARQCEECGAGSLPALPARLPGRLLSCLPASLPTRPPAPAAEAKRPADAPTPRPLPLAPAGRLAAVERVRASGALLCALGADGAVLSEGYGLPVDVSPPEASTSGLVAELARRGGTAGARVLAPVPLVTGEVGGGDGARGGAWSRGALYSPGSPAC